MKGSTKMNADENGHRWRGPMRMTCGVCLALSMAWGCGPKDPASDKQARSATRQAPVEEETTTDQARRRGRRPPDRIREDETAKTRQRRKKNQARLQRWAKQHLYMRLTLEKIEIEASQLTTLSDMNWAHFIALEKQKNERPDFDAALLKMLEKGQVETAPFEAERKWLEENRALQEAQLKERMTILHQTLNESQRARLLALVETEQKKQYAEEDKRVAAAPNDVVGIPGCGTRGFRLFRRFIDKRALTRKQLRAVDRLRNDTKNSPTRAEMADLRQARRIYDMAIRKGFARSDFDINKAIRPTSPFTEPALVTACQQSGFETLLGILTEADRKAAVAKLEQRRANREKDAADAGPTLSDSDPLNP